MESEKDEGKQIVSGFHISDGDEGGSRTVSKAVYEGYSVNSQRLELSSGPSSMMIAPPVNACSNLFSQASLSNVSWKNVSGVKRKARPILTSMNECPQSSHGRPSNYRNPSSSSSLMIKAKCFTVPLPSGAVRFSNRCTDESDLAVSAFRQNGEMPNHGNLQLHVKKEKHDASSSKLHCASSIPFNETRCGDQAMRLHQNLVGESSKTSQNETNRSNFPLCLEFKGLHKSKSIADGISVLSGPATRGCTSADKSTKIDLMKECSNDKDDSLSLKIGDCVKREKMSDAFVEGLDLNPDEVARVIGQRVFLKARKTMVHQQKIFYLQMFELHRLITVQKHIARSPQILNENSFDPNNPSIKFPPINNLLYVAPLDSSPSTAKAKVDNTLKPDLATECGTEALRGLLDVEKRHLSEPSTPKSIPMDPKLAPWCFAGNQWLVPIRSPSEGLIFKPYPGPCFPNSGFMGPVYGTCAAPISLSLLGNGGVTHGVPQSVNHGSGSFCGYLEPAMSSSSTDNSNFVALSQHSGVVSDYGGNLHNGSEIMSISETSQAERLEGDALSLFPTTPSLQGAKNEQKVQAIKAVPHNRMSASASAARIFQSIQEERRKQE